MPALPETLGQPPEATIQFSDVFGNVPLDGNARAFQLPDFDSDISAQVGNTGHFTDGRYPIGNWPSIGDYLGVFIWQQREEQLKTLSVRPKDVAPVVTVINCAPRTNGHCESGVNGDEFHLATTENGLEIYTQPVFLRGLAARGLIKALYRIPNDCGLWTPGEQFRSATVAQARKTPSFLTNADPNIIPEPYSYTRLVFADVFGNTRLEHPCSSEIKDLLSSGALKSVRLRADVFARDVVAKIVRNLAEIPEDSLGIYVNPSEVEKESDGTRPGYIELVRRVSDPNTSRRHAYATLLDNVLPGLRSEYPVAWDKTPLTIDA